MKDKIITVMGRKFRIEPSTRKNKQNQATSLDGKLKIHFGDKNMKEYPATKRGDAYCARSSGIKSSQKYNANIFSRKLLWNCKGKKSYKIEVKNEY